MTFRDRKLASLFRTGGLRAFEVDQLQCEKNKDYRSDSLRTKQKDKKNRLVLSSSHEALLDVSLLLDSNKASSTLKKTQEKKRPLLLFKLPSFYVLSVL